MPAEKRARMSDAEKNLREGREAAAAAPKLKFIPKKVREREEAERKAKEEDEERRRNEQLIRESEEWKREAKRGNFAFCDRKKDTRQGNSRHHDAQHAIPTGPKAMRNMVGDSNGANGPRLSPPLANWFERPTEVKGKGTKQSAEQIEMESLRTKYMGPDVNKSTFSAHKKRKRNDKFNFGWDLKDDTSRNSETATGPIGLDRRSEEEVLDEEARRIARGIERGDPETGRERARQYMEQHERLKSRRGLKEFGKHWSEKPLEDMRERDWRIFKENFGITTKGGTIPNPMRKWRESDLPSRLLDIVEQVGYDEPTPIQRAAIPIALQARDLIGVAVTGSGKTAAFLLPLLVYIKELPPLDEHSKNDGPYGLILAPTRELAQQIENEAKKFATEFGYTVVSIVGGHSLEEQTFSLRNGAEIIVATPGRLVDCLERRMLVLSQCCYLIMDEADRMIDLGFEESLTKILGALPVTNEKPDTDDAENAQAMTKYLGGRNRYRQTMMYTATMSSVVEKIARKHLRRPAIVTIGNDGEAVETVEQRVEFVSGEDKRKKRLQEILNSRQFQPPIIVFVNIKRNCDTVAKDIRSMGYSAVVLHGSKTQDEREAALASVRDGKTDILVATDLAGRGLDVADVSLVVNFNMATNIDSYTHRIGRTGRAGKSGIAITFLGNEDSDVLYDLKQMISKSSISKLPEELRRHEAAQNKPSKSGYNKYRS